MPDVPDSPLLTYFNTLPLGIRITLIVLTLPAVLAWGFLLWAHESMCRAYEAPRQPAQEDSHHAQG